jgi:hypothetical protein
MNSQKYFQPEVVTIPLIPFKEFLQEGVAAFSVSYSKLKTPQHLYYLRELRDFCSNSSLLRISVNQ